MTKEELLSKGAVPKPKGAAPQGMTREQLQSSGAVPKTSATPTPDATTQPMATGDGFGIYTRVAQKPTVSEPWWNKAYDASQSVMHAGGQVVTGAAKGLASTMAGALTLGEKAAAKLTGAEGAPLGKALTGEDKPLGTQIREELVNPEGTAQKVGFGAEQIYEFFTQAPAKALATNLGAKLGPKWAVAGRIIGSGADYASKSASQKATYEDIPQDVAIGAAGESLAVFGEGAMKKLGERFYKSAIKPPTNMSPQDANKIVRTGLDEKILLTKHADDIVHAKIDALDDSLEVAINNAEKAGKTVNVKEMKPMMESAKKFFGTQADVKEGQKAVQEIDDMYASFVDKYGENISPTLAQELKRNTMSLLRKSYGKLSTVSTEAQKEMAAGLRVGIEKATAGEAATLNAKMKSLIEFDKVLDKAMARISNSDLFSMKSMVMGGLATGSPQGAAMSGLVNLGASSTVKSGIGIALDMASKISAKTGTPIQVVLGELAKMWD